MSEPNYLIRICDSLQGIGLLLLFLCLSSCFNNCSQPNMNQTNHELKEIRKLLEARKQ